MKKDLLLINTAAFLRSVSAGLTGVVVGICLFRNGFSSLNIGLVIAAGLAGAAVAPLIVSLRADHLGRRTTLIVAVANNGVVTLQPAPRTSGLGRVIAELFALAEIGHLNRLKMCDSDECRWVFYDRSKPSNRRWCSTVLCGNRHKTRACRDRRRNDAS
jgi:predicted RNA-binding Zn ribbon-like protein